MDLKRHGFKGAFAAGALAIVLAGPTTAHAQSVLTLLDQLGVERFHLLGHSMGGMVVQEIVRLAPARVQRLVLYATGPQGSIPGRFETLARSRERLAEDGLERTARRTCATSTE